MSRGLMGKKLGMTATFSPQGTQMPVTVVEAGPCTVTQIKTVATDVYNALQLGFEEKKTSRVSKPLRGHFNKSGGAGFKFLREFAVENPEEFSLGQKITVDIFQVGERVDVVGTTKGRGFSGVIKRHGFHRGPMTHGSKNIRPPGSVGSSAWPSRVVKGKKLPGHYGNERRTMRNLEVVDIRPDENLILLKGAVPGATSGPVAIHKHVFKVSN
jgi:large subunit ribosomal protein L3